METKFDKAQRVIECLSGYSKEDLLNLILIKIDSVSDKSYVDGLITVTLRPLLITEATAHPTITDKEE